MYEITIWSKYKDREWEEIDICMEDELENLMGEYRMAFGKDFTFKTTKEFRESGGFKN